MSKKRKSKLIWSNTSVRISPEALKETLESENHKKNMEAVELLRKLGAFK